MAMITEDSLTKSWNVVYLSDTEFFSRTDLKQIAEMGSINFHIYILDYDNDGLLDVVLPN
jgi:hypothetical protein